MFLISAAFILHAAASERVDLILALSTDVSNSIDQHEYELQKLGIANALADRDVAGDFARCAPGGAAIAYVEWAGPARAVVDFRKIKAKSDLQNFANEVRVADRAYNSATNVAGALRVTHDLIRNAAFEAPRVVIDISSDGIQNVSVNHVVPPEDRAEALGRVRDELVDQGVIINALVIDDQPQAQVTYGGLSLLAYWTKFVVGGPGAFARVARSFADVSAVFKAKVRSEVCDFTAFAPRSETTKILSRLKSQR